MMVFKKLLSILLILCMVIAFAACGSRASDDEDNDDSDSKSTSKEKGGLLSRGDDADEDNEDEANDDEDKQDDDDVSSGDKGDDENSDEETDDDNDGDEGGSSSSFDPKYAVELPKSFPDDLFPIFKGGLVIYGAVDDSQGYDHFSVVVNFPASVADVSSFYNTLLANSEDKNDNKGDGYFGTSGKYKGYSFNIFLMEGENKKESVMTLELKEIPSADDVMGSVDAVEMPEDYPTGKFPVIDGGKVYASEESEFDGKMSYRLSVYTNKTYKEIVAFYEDKLGSIENKEKTVGNEDFNLSGTANGYYFYISGRATTLNNAEINTYDINIDPAE